MKLLILTLAAAGMMFFAPQAFADEGKLLTLMDATQNDYNTLKTSFHEARRTGSQEAYQKKLDSVMARISARRQTLRSLGETANRTLPTEKLGLAKMLIGDLDHINLSILALAQDERGLAGYLRTGDEELIAGISSWQEGIRQGLIESRRCIKLARSIMGPFTMAFSFRAVAAH